MFCLKYYSLELKCIGERNILVIDKLCFVIVKKRVGMWGHLVVVNAKREGVLFISWISTFVCVVIQVWNEVAILLMHGLCEFIKFEIPVT